METKAEQEERALSLFRLKLKDFPEGRIVKDEAPDYLIHSFGRVVGVEIRHLYKFSEGGKRSLRSVERQLEKIRGRALKLASASDMPFADVSIFHNDTIDIQEREIDKIAEELFVFVRTNMPQPGESVEWDYFSGRDRGQPLQFDQVWISRKYADRHHWVAPKAGSVQHDCITLIQSAIDEKAPKLPDYLKKCDECWLLMSINALHGSGSIHPGDESLEYQYQSPFERTYFLDPLEHKLHELKVRRS